MTSGDISRELRLISPRIRAIISTTRARHQLQPHIETDDLYSVGLMAAWKALQTFDGSRGVPRRTFVDTAISRGLLDYQRKQESLNGLSRHDNRRAHLVSLDQQILRDEPDTFEAFLADPIDPYATVCEMDDLASLIRSCG